MSNTQPDVEGCPRKRLVVECTKTAYAVSLFWARTRTNTSFREYLAGIRRKHWFLTCLTQCSPFAGQWPTQFTPLSGCFALGGPATRTWLTIGRTTAWKHSLQWFAVRRAPTRIQCRGSSFSFFPTTYSCRPSTSRAPFLSSTWTPSLCWSRCWAPPSRSSAKNRTRAMLTSLLWCWETQWTRI